MRKILFTMITLLSLWACSNDEMVQSPQPTMGIATKSLSRATSTGLGVDQQVLFLQDGTSHNAGQLIVTSNAPEVFIRWNVSDSCNLDTTRTSLAMSNGSARLDIKWDKMQENGNFAPAATAFDNGILLSDGASAIYVHLILTKDPDIANYSDILNRSAAEAAEVPNAVGIFARPAEIMMSEQRGGYTILSTVGAAPLGLTFDKIGSYTNIDYSSVTDFYPSDVTNEQIRFNWNANGAPDTDFSVPFTIFGIDNDLSADVQISYYKQDAPTLEVTPNTFEVAPTGATITTQISTNQTKWTLEKTGDIPTWITYSAATGNAGISGINLTVAPNTTVEPRYATLTIKAGALTKGIDITQLGITPTLAVSPTSFPTVKAEGESIAVTVSSNTTWNVVANAAWLHANKTSGNGNASVTFTVDENRAATTRTATATIKTTVNGTTPIIKTITFTQSEGAKPVNPGGITIDDIGDSEDININGGSL